MNRAIITQALVKQVQVLPDIGRGSPIVGAQEFIDKRPHGLIGVPEQAAQHISAQSHGLGAAAGFAAALHEQAVHAAFPV